MRCALRVPACSSGLSGGSDSVALTLLLRDLAAYDEFTVVSLAHLNHQLRPTATRDEDFCRDLAERLAIPIVIERRDVKAYGDIHTMSLEDAARRVRYDFLGRAAAEAGATRVAVGHTQDDQAETFLLKLMRGAGLTGLGGIYPRRGLRGPAAPRCALEQTCGPISRRAANRGWRTKATTTWKIRAIVCVT